MQSRAQTVTEYLKEIPSDRLDALTEIRDLCLQNLKGFQEGMEYGIPCYTKAGETKIAFASQKNYISFYIMNPELLKKYKAEIRGVSLGKTCLNFTNPEKINFSVIQKILSDIYHQNSLPQGENS